METFFVPSVAGLLNALSPPATKVRLPSECMDGGPNSRLPAFASTFADDSSIYTTILGLFAPAGYRSPITLALPTTCTYAGWMAGGACTLQLNIPLAGSSVQVALDHCPSSALPSISVSCAGPWCANLAAPCSTGVGVVSVVGVVLWRHRHVQVKRHTLAVGH